MWFHSMGAQHHPYPSCSSQRLWCETCKKLGQCPSQSIRFSSDTNHSPTTWPKSSERLKIPTTKMLAKCLFRRYYRCTCNCPMLNLHAPKCTLRFPPVFHDWFIETFPEPTAWLASRLAYGRTAAVMSMVGFILGYAIGPTFSTITAHIFSLA